MTQQGIFLVVGIAAFALVAALAFVRARAIESRTVAVLRTLIPSWRFFDELGAIPTLEFRLRAPGGEWAAWQPAIGSGSRGPLGLIFNPRGNLNLACHSLVTQLATDLDEKTGHAVSYALVRNLVRSRAGGAEFQFRLLLDGEEALLSEEHSC